MTRACTVCGKPADFTCGGCKLASYCGKDHQRQDWKSTHKSVCKPLFKLETNDRLGRHLVAVRPIKKGELIFQEPPLVCGPKAVSSPVCLGCHAPCGPKGRDCDGCGYPLCSVQCQVADAHFDECQIMMKNKLRVKIEPDAVDCNHYGPIVPMRIMMMKEKQPEKYKKILAMVSHLEERMKTPLYTVYKNNLAQFLRQGLSFTTWDDEAILNLAAILDTNAFEVRMRGRKLRALYGTAAMMAHDCTANTRHTYHGDEFTIAVSATVDIPVGSPITTTYTQKFLGTMARRAHLKAAKFFMCSCRRCEDPTELGTYLGAFRCSRCATREGDGPKMVSTEPLNDNAPWKCAKCLHEIPAKLVKSGNDNLRREIELLDKSTPVALEAFLEKYDVATVGILHPSNTFVVQVKHALIQMYGNRPGLLYADIDPVTLGKKIEYCHELLEVIDKLDPGFSRIRGQILSELQASMVMQSKRLYSDGQITKEAAQEILGESMVILAEVIEIMRNESDAEELRTRLELLSKEIDE